MPKTYPGVCGIEIPSDLDPVRSRLSRSRKQTETRPYKETSVNKKPNTVPAPAPKTTVDHLRDAYRAILAAEKALNAAIPLSSLPAQTTAITKLRVRLDKDLATLATIGKKETANA
jgi:hypothetical protein